MPRLTLHIGGLACLFVVLATTVNAGTVLDGQPSVKTPWQLQVGTTAGAMSFDSDLANYRWDTQPALQTGLMAMLYHDRVGIGARIWRSQTTQASGIPGATQSPLVNLTATEVVGQVRAFAYRSVELWGSAHTGLLHLGYDPDQLTYDSSALPQPITVNYTPINEWDIGVGVEVRAMVASQTALSLHAEQTTFQLDTAHRVGSEIVEARERFYSWSLRMQVAWLLTFE